MIVYLLPGYGILNETATNVYLLPGYGILNEIVSGGGALSINVSECVECIGTLV